MQLNLVLESYPELNLTTSEIRGIINAWVISGIVGISLLTVALNSMFIAISDREKHYP